MDGIEQRNGPAAFLARGHSEAESGNQSGSVDSKENMGTVGFGHDLIDIEAAYNCPDFLAWDEFSNTTKEDRSNQVARREQSR